MDELNITKTHRRTNSRLSQHFFSLVFDLFRNLGNVLH